MKLELRGITKRFGDLVAVLDIAAGNHRAGAGGGREVRGLQRGGGNAVHAVDAFGLDDVEEPAGFESLLDDDGAATQQRGNDGQPCQPRGNGSDG